MNELIMHSFPSIIRSNKGEKKGLHDENGATELRRNNRNLRQKK